MRHKHLIKAILLILILFNSKVFSENKTVYLDLNYIFNESIAGKSLNDDLAKYIIARASREMKSLMCCLDILEEASLQEKRELSIPFVRKIFSW